MASFLGIKQWELASGFVQRQKKKIAAELSQKGAKRWPEFEEFSSKQSGWEMLLLMADD